MKHWGSICLICLMLGACASDKKVAPTEGRLSLNDPLVIEKSQEKQILSAPQKYDSFLINGANAQNKYPHFSLKESDQSWKTKAGTTEKKEVPLLSSILVGNKNIYVLDADFNFFVYDKQGNRQSETQLKKNETGIALTSKKDNFYALSQNGTIIALDKKGKTLWKKELNTPFRNSPIVYKEMLYLLSADNNLWAFNAQNGKEIWHYQTTTPTTTLWGMGRPAVNNDILVVPFSNGLITAFNAQNGSFMWETDLVDGKSYNQIDSISQMIASPVIEENSVYLAGNAHSFKALNLKTGEEVWSNQLASTTTPLINGNTLFVLDNEGVLYALNKANGKQFWHQELPVVHGKTFLTLINNQVFLLTQDQMLIVDAKSGKIKSEIKNKKKVSAPIFTQNGLYFLSDDGKLNYQGNLK